MSPKSNHTDIIEQAQSILEAWKQIDPDLVIGGLNCAAMDAQIVAAGPIFAEINRLETQLMVQRSQRDTLNEELWDKIKRVRSAIKGIYGDDSMQYEMVGGTRVSDRKSGTHRVSNGA